MNSTAKSYQSFEVQIWHLMKVFIGYKESKTTVTIYPKTTYTIAGDLGTPLKIKIKSNEKIYWTQCKNYFNCYFSGSVLQATDCRRDSPVNSTTLVFIIVCGLLVVTVMGQVVSILIRWKKSELTEPEPDLIEDAIYEEVNMSESPGIFPRGQEHHETINRLYGITIQRRERAIVCQW
ncbi:uncharacterized protein LOC135196423 [Macrobrachium nipponense]|uniref:uncharacterized protein LOC135196423 n=1 Tax=Macrobrachium nipponense TaxID=159736 RepID=UPI0030C80942